jgi:hypothetical protein
MSDTTPAPSMPTPDPMPATQLAPPPMPPKPLATLGARASKAWGAGVAGAVTAVGAVSVAGLFTAHGLDATAIAAAGGSIVGGFLLGFVGAYFPTNAVG